MAELTDQKVLVTGACGSIGSEIVAGVLDKDPAVVRALDTNESGLHDLKREITDSRVRYLLGNIRDRDRLAMAMEDIDVVFHAAALKHVELNEYNPFEAVRTNVQGTQNAVRTALDQGVESFVTVSTDKASNPVSVMGATKLLSERLVIAANAYKGPRDTQFGCVRFGNVLGTEGSVVPLFIDQIRNKGPVTVTDPDMTRFIMTVEKAVDLVFQAYEQMIGGEVFVFKMPALRIGDLAEAMIEHYAPQFGYDAEDISTEIIGSRPAERVHEKLISIDEARQARELSDMFVILPEIDIPNYDVTSYSQYDSVSGEYTSGDKELLTQDQIVDILCDQSSLGKISGNISS